MSDGSRDQYSKVTSDGSVTRRAMAQDVRSDGSMRKHLLRAMALAIRGRWPRMLRAMAQMENILRAMALTIMIFQGHERWLQQ